MLDVSWMCRQHMEGLLVTKSDPSIIQSFITVLVLFAMVQTDINPPNTMIPTIEYPDPHIPIITTIKYSILIPSNLMIPTIKHPDPHIPLIPTHLIQWFWLFQLFWLLNIQLQSAQCDDSNCWISQSTYSNHSDLLNPIILTIEYLIGYLPDPSIHWLNIQSVIHWTLAYAKWIYNRAFA